MGARLAWGLIFVQLVACGVTPRTTASGPVAAPLPKASRPAATLTHDARLVDIDGKLHVLANDPRTQATVFVFLGNECSISQQYVPTLNALFRKWRAAGIDFIAVVADLGASRDAVKRFRDDFALEIPVLFDGTGNLSSALRPSHTPESIVFGKDGVERFRGAIDDRVVGIGRSKAEASRSYLDAALASIVGGKPVEPSVVESVGCVIEPHLRNGQLPPVLTYNRDVAPILNANCIDCHRDGGAGPFSLTSYAQAQRYAHTIATATDAHEMPPYFAVPSYGHLRDVRALTEREIRILSAWAEAGAPEGNSADLPAAPPLPTGKWPLGEPDMVLRVPNPVTYPATGHDTYWNFIIGRMTEDHAIAGIDVRPSAPKVIHHIQLWREPTDFARKLDAAHPGKGYASTSRIVSRDAARFGGWNPGAKATVARGGIGYYFRKGDDIVMNIHYRPTGKVEVDQTEVAVYFAKEPVTREVRFVALRDIDVRIPPGADHYHQQKTYELHYPTTILGMNPHMHSLGKEFKAHATLPDGRDLPLIWLTHWNWRWAPSYSSVRPISLPAGTKITVECVFDNSAKNPENPNQPPREVLYGMGIKEEMCNLGYGAVFEREADYLAETKFIDDEKAVRTAVRYKGVPIDEYKSDMMDLE